MNLLGIALCLSVSFICFLVGDLDKSETITLTWFTPDKNQVFLSKVARKRVYNEYNKATGGSDRVSPTG